MKFHSDHYKPNRAFNTISDLKQIGRVQKYLNDINRLNVCAKMTDHHLISNIQNGIAPRLCQAIVYYEDLRLDPSEWKEKLVCMNFITREFQQKEQDNKSKGLWQKGTLEKQVQLRGGEELGSEKKKNEFVPKEVQDKRKIKGQFMKCGSVTGVLYAPI